MTPHCFLSRFSSVPCDGRLVRAHLLPRALLRREHPRNWRELAQDPRTWVYACGGVMGNGAHHGAFDTARTIRVPRWALPDGTAQLAEYLGLGWYVDRTFGCDEGQEAA